MQQIAIIDYNGGTIDIYPYPDDYDGYVEDWIYENNIPYKYDECYWLHRKTEIPVTVHDRLPQINRRTEET